MSTKNHKPHLYGISERIIKKIIFECLDDKALFAKLEDEIRKFIEGAGGVDSIISAKLDEILKDSTEDFNSFIEVENWIHAHEDLYNTLIKTLIGSEDLEDKINNLPEIYKNEITVLKKKIEEQEKIINELKKLLDDNGNLRNLVTADVKEEVSVVQNSKPKFDAVWGGMGIRILDDDI